MADRKIGIVTVMYNSAGVLEGFFDSLDRSTYRNFVVYAIDNQSPDDSLLLASEHSARASFPTVIIKAEDNGGVAKGNDIGIRRALADGCDLVLLANNDIEFTPESIALLVEGLEKYDCDMIVPKIFNYFTGKLWAAGGGEYGFINPTTHFGYDQDDAPQYNEPRSLEFAPTCFMLIKKEVFDKIGIMDERYFAYFDDTDFVWRAVRQNGLKLHYEPQAVVQHKAGTSSGSKPSPFAFYLNTRNRAYFMNKYYTWHRRLCVNLYNFTYYFLYSVKHPSLPSIFKNFGYYREGLKMYRQWLAEQQPRQVQK